MRLINTFLLSALIATSFSCFAQDTQTVTVPLTRPGEPITLDVDLIRGEIHVIGDDREDAIFEISASGGERKIVTPSGPKTIPGGSMDLEIEEQNNRITVDSDWRSSHVNLTVRIPRRANLSLETTHDGVITVDGVEGELELNNIHGPIYARRIQGVIVAESVHGDIEAELLAAPSDKPMAFEAMHGNITVKLPADFGAELRILSGADEVFTDFEVEFLPNEPKINRRSDGGRFVVEMDREIIAAINGGGPQIRIETRYGEVRVLKAGSSR